MTYKFEPGKHGNLQTRISAYYTTPPPFLDRTMQTPQPSYSQLTSQPCGKEYDLGTGVWIHTAVIGQHGAGFLRMRIPWLGFASQLTVQLRGFSGSFYATCSVRLSWMQCRWVKLHVVEVILTSHCKQGTHSPTLSVLCPVSPTSDDRISRAVVTAS